MIAVHYGNGVSGLFFPLEMLGILLIFTIRRDQKNEVCTYTSTDLGYCAGYYSNLDLDRSGIFGKGFLMFQGAQRVGLNLCRPRRYVLLDRRIRL